MLVDAAKDGDVEIPVFCYEPKLGGPVGACRMCLVEIEGIPKLQTACSTPVRDGMVVYTRTDRVIEAQNAVVEFLLVNHPLDCPVCDKGGECPLQDIAMGWGPGTQPRRPTRSATSRSRCRSRRWSGSTASAASSATAACASARRSPRTSSCSCSSAAPRRYVGTFDDRPYIAPFHGNIIELCPVGALTSEAYRFRARPWDIEDAGSICTLCPSQCNVKFTVRDERVQRVLARDNHEVDDGWLCDKGRFGFQMIASPGADHRAAVVGRPRAASWEEALEAAADGPARSRRAHRRDRRRPGLERGGLPGPADRPRGARLAARRPPARARRPRELRARCRGPGARRQRSPTSTRPSRSSSLGTDPLHAMPILDLRIRKAVRHGRRAARGRLRPADGARRRRRGDRALRARRRRRRSWPRSPPSSAPTARPAPDGPSYGGGRASGSPASCAPARR